MIGVTARRVVVTWVAMVALWLLLAAEVSAAEVVAASLAATVVAVLVELVARIAPERVALRGTWLRLVPGALWQTVADCWTVTVHLVRVLRGRSSGGMLRTTAYAPAPDHPAEPGRRAFITWVTSLQPNSYVLGFDEDRGQVVTHQLVPTDDEPIAAELLAPPEDG